MKPHFGYPMVCTKMWHVHFLSQRTLELVPFPAAPWAASLCKELFFKKNLFDMISTKYHQLLVCNRILHH